MPYVQRDLSGHVIGLFNQPHPDAAEELSVEAPEVVEFLVKMDASALSRLTTSDLAMARVTEDMVELLMEKNIILFTELPEAAQRKLLDRRSMRGALRPVTDIIVNETLL